MEHSLHAALRALTRFEIGTHTLLREMDEDPLLFNASLAEDGVAVDGPGLHFIVGEETYGTVDDDAPWASLG